MGPSPPPPHQSSHPVPHYHLSHLQASAALDALASELSGGSQPVSLLSDVNAVDAGSLANPFNQMFKALGISLGGGGGGGGAGSSGGAGAGGGAHHHPGGGGSHALITVPSFTAAVSAASERHHQSGGGGGGRHDGPARFAQLASPRMLKPLPGAGLALWALSEGRDAVEKVGEGGEGA